MPNKTVYVQAADVPTWDRAKSHAESRGLSMSELIVMGLQRMLDEASQMSEDTIVEIVKRRFAVTERDVH